MEDPKTRWSRFAKKNAVVLVMVPVIIGLHLGWSLLQRNEAFVPKDMRRDLPIVDGIKYVEQIVEGKLHPKSGRSE